jgi:DNA-binding Xre family transcriptional regulator
MMEAGYQHQGQHDVQGEQEEYQMQNSFKKIEELENYGINKTDIIKLKAGGYHTIEAVRLLCPTVGVKPLRSCTTVQIAHGSLRKLVEVKGISEQKAQKLKELIKTNNLVSVGFQTATSKLECMKDTIMLSTGKVSSQLLVPQCISG